MREAVVLGSGTSHGVPMLGKTYPPAFLANPRNHRMRPSLALVGAEGVVLVDAGPDMRTQLLRESISRVDAVILTHSHADHIMGMDDLRAFTQATGAAMPIYAAPECAEVVERVYDYAFRPGRPGLEVPNFALFELADRLVLAGFEIEVLWVWHGEMRVAALRVGGLVYMTDVGEIPDDVWPRLAGLDTLILDAVRRRPHPSHFNLERAVDAALRIGARRTYFTHLSGEFDHDATNAELPDGIELAWDGLRIPLDPAR